MASNYDIISATSDDVGNLSIPVSWNIENPETDLTIFVLRKGSLSKWDGWNYNSNTGVIAVIGISEQFSAFVFRTEQAAILASLVSTNEVRVGDIIEQLKKDNRVLEQLQVIEKVALRTCDEILPIANSAARAGKVLAFGEDGNPDLSLSKEDVKGAYLARDEAKELKKETETLKNQTAELKSDAENYKNYAIDAASKAVAAQGKAEVAQVAAEKAKADTGNLKSDVDATVSEFNSTVNSKVQEVEGAAQIGITAVNSAKTSALGEIAASKTSAISEVNAAKADAKTEIAADLENAKNEIDAWSEQTERFAKNEADISALAIDKANRGALWYNKAKLTTATNNATTLPLTLCVTYECADLSSGLFNFLATHKVKGWTSSGQTGSTSGFGFGIINNENYVNRIFGVKLSTPDATNSVARHGYDCGVWLKSDSFENFEGRHTFIATISEEITNGVPKIVLYLDGSVLSPNRNFKYNGGLQSAELDTGQGKISTGSTEYSPTNISTIPVKLSRLKIFNCVLPATKADDVNGIGYTVEDYHNGVDEPPTMHNASATYRALLSLQDYTITNGSTQQVFDVSGNANDATATLSDGGSLKGSNDIGVSRLIDFIKGQSV